MRFPEIDTLFVHVPKTGGTTISLEVSKYLYPEEFKKGRSIIDMYKVKERRVVDRDVRKAHVYAYQYRDKLGEELYNKHFSFAFIRNPFEQIRSLFLQLTYMNVDQNPKFLPYKKMSFERFILSDGLHSLDGNDEFVNQSRYILDKNEKEIIVDQVLPFDYYHESLKILSVRLGIPINKKVIMRATKGVGHTYTPEMASKVIDRYGQVYELYKKIKKDFEKNVLSKK